MLSDSAMRELSSAARRAVALRSDAPSDPVPVAAITGCRTCRKYALCSGDDSLSLRGRDKMSFLSACGACKEVFYCSRECQKADWKAHKPACLAARKEQKPTVELHIHDLGHMPAPEVIEAAVAEFHAKRARGLFGKDNPVPSFTNAAGERRYC